MKGFLQLSISRESLVEVEITEGWWTVKQAEE